MNSLAYLDGEFLDASAARVPVWDLGVVGGIAVSEMLRTFRHQPFRVVEHLQRLQQSCELTGIPLPVSLAELESILHRVVSHNAVLTAETDDLGLILFVTAGWNPTYVGRATATAHGSTLGVHTFPLQHALWSEKYATGVSLRTATIPALPASIVDRRIKARSRLHWHLADRSVRAIEPGAVAALLDDDGSVTETPAANILAVIEGVLVTPPAGQVLEGVSLQATLEHATALGLPVARQRISPADLDAASELLLSSTPSCLLPVTRWNGNPVGTGTPGIIFQHLLNRWSLDCGVDIADQARRHSEPASTTINNRNNS